MICGIASGAVVQRPVQLRKFCWNSNDETDEQTAHEGERQALQPADDRGGERVDRISSVSVCTSRVASSSARKMPAIAAIDEPSAHENIDTAAGLDAVERGELAVVDDRAHRDTEAGARAGGTCRPTASAEPDDDRDEARPRHERLADAGTRSCRRTRSMCARLLGSQIRPARPMSASMRPIVVTICATSGASARRRMRTRSISAPMSGAATNTVSNSATKVWIPQLTCSSQKMYAMNMPDRALGEVEDARGRVGDDQAGGGDRVDRAVR